MKNLSGLMAVLAIFLCASISYGQDNLMVPDTWLAGTGHHNGYLYTGDISENEREPGTDPFGFSSILWVAKPSGNSVHDGGFRSPLVENIDTNKTYRFSVWIKKTGSTTGSTYFGLFTRSSTDLNTNSNVVTQNLYGDLRTNPYFWSGDLPQLDRWYLLVGYLRPNSYSGSSAGAMYDGVTKTKVTGFTFPDYKFGNGAAYMELRSLLFNDNNVGDFQYYYRPAIHEADLTNPALEEQKIQELLGQSANNPVTGVSLSPNSASFDVNATQQLNANVLPTNATVPSVSWSSNNTSVATVSPTGLVTAHATGNAIITVTTNDGNFTANANISVTATNTGGDFGSYKLYNATANSFFGNIVDGSTYYMDEIGGSEITIEAVAPQSYINATHGKKVRFNISPSSESDHLEGAHPYFMRGDDAGVYNGWTPPLNTPVTFTISYYDNTAGTGTPIGSDQFTITFGQSAANNPPSGDTVWSESNSTVSYNGNVQVGNVSVPSGYKMAVDGKLITEEVKVELSDTWADYVFFKDYNLPTLQEVEKHIEENGHLINIPSATEVEANGIELGEMNKLLLEKIEELTLYILQQEKRIEFLEAKR